jgi:hypothetical protein
MQISYIWQVLLIMNYCSIRYKIKNALGPRYWNSLFYNQSIFYHISRIFTELLRSRLVWFGSREKVVPQNWSVKSVIYWIRVRYMTIHWPITRFQGLRTTKVATMDFSDFKCLRASPQPKSLIQSSQLGAAWPTYLFVQLQLFTSRTHYKNYTT